MGPILVAVQPEPISTGAPRTRPGGAGRFEDRARRLRLLAVQAPGPLAVAYRRRACELELLAAVTGNAPFPALW